MSAELENRLADEHAGANTVEFGWADADEDGSHGYLLPVVFEELRRATNGEPCRIADVGCGNGSVTAKIAMLGHEVIGVDASRDGIEIARDAYPHLRFEAVSLYDENFGDLVRTVDCVLALEVVEHLFRPAKLFEASYRALKPGGTMIVSTPYHGYLKNLGLSLTNGWDRHFHVDRDGGHIKFFSSRTLSQMARAAGFKNLRWRGAGRVSWLWKSLVMVMEKP
jgi:2-polyprenyl-3-methyl-5-hydroxy-6-metoxy-1,4-benzoquinol methylase